MWTQIKAYILLDAIREAGVICFNVADPKELEKNVTKLHNLFAQVKAVFATNEIGMDHVCPSAPVGTICGGHHGAPGNYVLYDRLLFDAVFNYLRTPICPVGFNYVIRPQLNDVQLNTIKCVIETAQRFTRNKNMSEAYKLDIITELAKEYDLANEKFISFYEDIFNQLNENLDEEENVKPNSVTRISNRITGLITTMDNTLFTKLMLFIRSRMVYLKHINEKSGKAGYS